MVLQFGMTFFYGILASLSNVSEKKKIEKLE